MDAKSVLFAAVCVMLLAVCHSEGTFEEIKRFQLDEAQLVWTDDNNYAIYHPQLLKNFRWHSISVQGDSLILESEDCISTTRTLASLSLTERKSLASAKAKLQAIDEPEFSPDEFFCSAVWRVDKNAYKVKRCRRLEVTMATTDEYFMQKMFDKQTTKEQLLSAGSSRKSNTVARAFVNPDAVTFVYREGKVRMRPAYCLSYYETALIQYINDLYSKAEQEGNFKENVMSFNYETPVRRLGNMLAGGVQAVLRLADSKIKQVKGGPSE